MLCDDVSQAFEVLDVDGADDGDAGAEDVFDILPAFFVNRSRRVGVGNLVDQRHGWLTAHDGVRVHLLDRHALVDDLLARDNLESLRNFGRPLSAVRLQKADDRVGAAVLAADELL